MLSDTTICFKCQNSKHMQRNEYFLRAMTVENSSISVETVVWCVGTGTIKNKVGVFVNTFL